MCIRDRYPIIDLGENHYLIPSLNILLEALTYKVFDVIFELQKNSHNFKTKFGDVFENYIRDLTKFRHLDYFYECSDLVLESGKRKAEFYLLKNDTTIVIESKLLHVDENIILHKSTKDIKSKFQDTIASALEQIDECFKRIKTENKFGIIVIHTHIPLFEFFAKYFDYKNKYDFIENIIILSIVNYEILIDSSFEEIVKYFQLPNDNNKAQVALYFEQKNEFLMESYFSLTDEIKKNIKKADE